VIDQTTGEAPLLVAFRVDASLQMGSGHVMRCLTLADALRKRGARVYFVSRLHEGCLVSMVERRGYQVRELPAPDRRWSSTAAEQSDHINWLGVTWQEDAAQTQDALGDEIWDWLVVDHYALDHRWERLLREHCRKLMVIDDLADRVHDCDVLLDQNLGRLAQDYEQLVPDHCQLLISPQYALLRAEFSAWREYSLRRRQTSQLQRLLITMGGVDQANATAAVLTALRTCPLPEDCHITVVMGPHAPWLAQVQNLAATLPWTTEVKVNVDNMAQLMADSDLAIGAAGSTSWERCCLGLPTLMLVLAENQRGVAKSLHSAGAAVSLGDVQGVSNRLAPAVSAMLASKKRAAIASAASTLCDGRGAQRLLNCMGKADGR